VPRTAWRLRRGSHPTGGRIARPPPANRTLGLTIAEATDGVGRAVLPVTDGVRNVIGALHSNGVAALADATTLAAVLSVAPDETAARQLQPLGVQARLTFRRPVRGTAFASCHLDPEGRTTVASLFGHSHQQVHLATLTILDGDDAPRAAEGEFHWVVPLAPSQLGSGT
jgi:acyl-coenzyme A thioesterase PaaI-like protein